jgi:hypothetical protein
LKQSNNRKMSSWQGLREDCSDSARWLHLHLLSFATPSNACSPSETGIPWMQLHAAWTFVGTYVPESIAASPTPAMLLQQTNVCCSLRGQFLWCRMSLPPFLGAWKPSGARPIPHRDIMEIDQVEPISQWHIGSLDSRVPIFQNHPTLIQSILAVSIYIYIYIYILYIASLCIFNNDCRKYPSHKIWAVYSKSVHFNQIYYPCTSPLWTLW